MSAFQTIADTLLQQTAASRTTVRIFNQDGSVDLVAEALAPGIQSMRGGPIFNLTSAGTYQFLSQEEGLLLQNDCRVASPAPPQELIDIYHVYAQMLGSVRSNGRLAGTLAVHEVGRPRRWRRSDVAALRRGLRELEVDLHAPAV